MAHPIFRRTLLGATLMALPMTTLLASEPPKMKMTTVIPPGIETPNTLETHLGTLTSFDGVPDQATTQKVYDDLDLRRATEAFLPPCRLRPWRRWKKGCVPLVRSIPQQACLKT